MGVLGGAAKALVAGGLPMAELIEVIKQHPQLKSRIQEIVQRQDLSEAQKMSLISHTVRDKGDPAPPGGGAAAPP